MIWKTARSTGIVTHRRQRRYSRAKSSYVSTNRLRWQLRNLAWLRQIEASSSWLAALARRSIALKIAETLAGKGKRVLFLVPSLNLLSQTLTEWTQESETPLHSFAVCSDSDVGKKRKKEDDTVQTFTSMSCVTQPRPNRRDWQLKWVSVMTINT